MALLRSKNYLRFDKDDVKLMQTMLKQFHEFHKGTGVPDYAINYAAYLPVFAIALLASQETVEKLTKKLVWLTWAIAFITIVIVALTLVLAFRRI